MYCVSDTRHFTERIGVRCDPYLAYSVFSAKSEGDNFDYD